MSRKSQDRTRAAWTYMHRICTDERHSSYQSVGARGIRVCERWNSFDNFLADMGERPAGIGASSYAIGRRDQEGDFTPENSCWMTRSERMRCSSSARFLTIDGVTKHLIEWAADAGISYTCLIHRLRRGIPPEQALFSTTRIRTQRTIELNGRTVNLSAVARQAGFCPETVAARLRLGWTPDEAISTPARNYAARVEYNGEALTLKEWSERLGIHYAALRYRLKAGWPLDKVFSLPLRKLRRTK